MRKQSLLPPSMSPEVVLPGCFGNYYAVVLCKQSTSLSEEIAHSMQREFKLVYNNSTCFGIEVLNKQKGANLLPCPWGLIPFSCPRLLGRS